MNKTGTAVNKVKTLLKSWQAFAGFHTEAASLGHWGNVRLTKIIKKTYQDGAAVDLNVDKERGCLKWTHLLTIGNNNIRKSMVPHPIG